MKKGPAPRGRCRVHVPRKLHGVPLGPECPKNLGRLIRSGVSLQRGIATRSSRAHLGTGRGRLAAAVDELSLSGGAGDVTALLDEILREPASLGEDGPELVRQGPAVQPSLGRCLLPRQGPVRLSRRARWDAGAYSRVSRGDVRRSAASSLRRDGRSGGIHRELPTFLGRPRQEGPTPHSRSPPQVSGLALLRRHGVAVGEAMTPSESRRLLPLFEASVLRLPHCANLRLQLTLIPGRKPGAEIRWERGGQRRRNDSNLKS